MNLDMQRISPYIEFNNKNYSLVTQEDYGTYRISVMVPVVECDHVSIVRVANKENNEAILTLMLGFNEAFSLFTGLATAIAQYKIPEPKPRDYVVPIDGNNYVLTV